MKDSELLSKLVEQKRLLGYKSGVQIENWHFKTANSIQEAFGINSNQLNNFNWILDEWKSYNDPGMGWMSSEVRNEKYYSSARTLLNQLIEVLRERIDRQQKEEQHEEQKPPLKKEPEFPVTVAAAKKVSTGDMLKVYAESERKDREIQALKDELKKHVEPKFFYRLKKSFSSIGAAWGYILTIALAAIGGAFILGQNTGKSGLERENNELFFETKELKKDTTEKNDSIKKLNNVIQVYEKLAMDTMPN